MQTNVTNDAAFLLGLITIIRFVVPALLLAFACWVLLILPQRRAAEQADAVRIPVSIGQVVTTLDGRSGVVCLVEPNRLIIQLVDGEKCQVSPYELSVDNHGAT